MKPKYNIIFIEDNKKYASKYPLFEMYWREQFFHMKVMLNGEIVNLRIGADEYSKIIIEEIQ